MSFNINVTQRITKGVLAILPIILSIWIFSFIYEFVAGLFKYIFGITDNNISATLFILSFTLLLLFYIGYLVEKNREFLLLKFTELVIDKIPVLKTIYSAIKDIIGLFSNSGKENYLGVVYVKFGEAKIIGFITKRVEKTLYVFVPTTPNPTTGLLLIMSEDDVEFTDMEVSDGFKRIMTLGTK